MVKTCCGQVLTAGRCGSGDIARIRGRAVVDRVSGKWCGSRSSWRRILALPASGVNRQGENGRNKKGGRCLLLLQLCFHLLLLLLLGVFVFVCCLYGAVTVNISGLL